MPDSRAERLYYAMPLVLQNAAMTLFGVRAAWERRGPGFRRRIRWLRETERWPAERIREFQDERLRAIVRHAWDTVPFYRRWYDEHGVHPSDIRGQDDLVKLPVLTKAMVRRNQEAMISTAFRRRDLRFHLTSGTTGTPLRIGKTAEAMRWQWAIWWRHRIRFGFAPGKRYLMLGARVPVPAGQDRPPFWREDRFGGRTYASAYHMAPEELPHFVDLLQRRAFPYIVGYPSALNVLATHMIREGVRLAVPPRRVITASESLLPHYEAALEEAFGAPVTDQYGMAEFAGNCSKCEEGRFHLDFECCCMEQLPVADLDGRVSLVFTGFDNPAMPFIRYEVGDYGVPGPERCGCGRASPTLEAIDGRIEDCLVTPDGRRIMGLNQVMEYGTGADEIQILQDRPDEIVVTVVEGPGYGPASERAMRRELERRLGPGVRIRFVAVDRIRRSGSGKVRAVISTVASTGEGPDDGNGPGEATLPGQPR